MMMMMTINSSSWLLLIKFVTAVVVANTHRQLQPSEQQPQQPDEEGWTPPSYTCLPSSGCDLSTHQCLVNPNHGQKSTDEQCMACQSGQTYWPCDVDGLCYCWDKSTSKIPPAPSTKLPINTNRLDPCGDDMLTNSVFDTLAPEAQFPYSYRGFCQAVRDYNTNHPTEGIFIMGNETQQRHELAAFFGNVLHESDELKAGREYLMCADHIEVGGEMYCKPCDVSGFDWETFKCTGSSLASEGRAFNSYCQSNLLPPDGCECDDVYEVSSEGKMAGYVKANQVYFGRGAIQLSWSYNYIKASVALTGHSQTFCQQPDWVATKEEYAWGAGLFYWMENVKNDMTCHQAVLMNNDFGQTLDIINGGLECPSDDAGWHGKAVQLRLNRYCRAATALGLDTLLDLGGCMDMNKKFVQCLKEGNCDACKVWEDKITLPDISTILTVEEGGSGGKGSPTKKPTPKKQNTKRPTLQPAVPPTLSTTTITSTTETAAEVVEEGGELESIEISGPCTGEPCPVPPGIEEEFCRSGSGICGTGAPYCNAHSTWTSFCFDCESDSPFGCPTFGCGDCSGETQQCVGNKNGLNPIRDGECKPCGKGQTFYPCDVEGSKGCWCWDTRLPRVEPAPPSGLEVVESSSTSYDESTVLSAGEGVCGVLIDKALFHLLAPNAQHPFTYEGFCIAIDHYNSRHAEKVFRMGTKQQRIDELTAFLGMASHETDGFKTAREYLACGDNIVVDGELYCMPCSSEGYNFDTHTCGISMLENDQSYMEFCQPYTAPPKGCNCEYVKEIEASGQLEGHMKANDIFFGRGSIQLSNNFNYIRASATMTGSEDTFCVEPELLSTVESYSWGVGIYIWMELMKEEGKTSHTHALNGNFGSALNIINGASECPVKDDDEWYAKAVRGRLDHYCKVAEAMGAINLLSFGGCGGLEAVFRECLADGSCSSCAYFDPNTIRTAPPTDPHGTSPPVSRPYTPPASTSVPKSPPPSSSRPKTSPPPSSVPTNAVTITSSSTVVEIAKTPTTSRRPTRKPTQSELLSIPTYQPTLSPESITPDELGIMTNWAMTSLEYPPTDKPSFKPTTLTGKDPVNESENNVVNEPPEIIPASDVVDHQKDEGEASLTTKIDDKTFSFKPLDDTTLSRANPDTNYGSEPSMIVNMIDGDVALISFDLSDLGDAPIDKAVLQLAILDENALNAAIFYVQPTTNVWAENTVTYNSAPKAGGSLFASAVDRTDSTHFKLDVTNAVANHVVSFRVIGTDKMRSEFGSKESSKKSDVPALMVTLASEQPSFTSSRPINDSDAGKGNPYDLSQLYQGKPSVVQLGGGTPNNSPFGRISGHVWLDNNNDGVKEADEPGLRGVLVDLYSCNDRWVAGTRTSSSGDYIFDELPEGDYYAVATAGADYGFSPKNVGSDDSKDSDVNATTGRSDCINLSSPLRLSFSIDVGMVKSELSFAETNPDVSDADETGSENYNCRGKPCTEGEGYCRSEHNYCGTGDTYCNEKSQWTSECPSAAPTIRPTLMPTTGQPSFAHDEGTNCSGEPCTEGDGTWCRSEIGFCGSGEFYCNTDSIWLPICDGTNSTDNAQNSTDTDNTLTLADVLESFNSVAVNTTIRPTKAPSRADIAEFSTFALPTLSHISNSNQTDTTMLGNMYGIETVHYDFQSDTPKNESQNVFTINDNEAGGIQQSNHDESWYSWFGKTEARQSSGIKTPSIGQFFVYLFMLSYYLC
ncbi:hypothetical protein ACHAXM_004897 [Skeletonema potamos]